MPTKTEAVDPRHMRAALALARRGLGAVWPNPTVGCVIVAPNDAGGQVVGRGWTQPGGRPHAETEALRRAGARARGATAYVSLEPCNHHGKTPPCTDALIAAGVVRVVGTVQDPDPRVEGRGYARLRDAGISVSTGTCAAEAEEINAGFFLRQQEGRPLVTLKMATSLDGRIATRTGESQWITGAAARAHGHLMRAAHDAVMVGIGTALADDPQLTCRLPGLEERSPVRIVLDSGMRLPLTSKLVATARKVPVWVLAAEDGDRMRQEALTDHGITVIRVARSDAGRLDLRAALHHLGARGLTRVLVEGGGTIAAALLVARLVDRVAWLRSGGLIGGDGVPAVAAYGVDRLEGMQSFHRLSVQALGDDLLESLRRQD